MRDKTQQHRIDCLAVITARFFFKGDQEGYAEYGTPEFEYMESEGFYFDDWELNDQSNNSKGKDLEDSLELVPDAAPMRFPNPDGDSWKDEELERVPCRFTEDRIGFKVEIFGNEHSGCAFELKNSGHDFFECLTTEFVKQAQQLRLEQENADREDEELKKIRVRSVSWIAALGYEAEQYYTYDGTECDAWPIYLGRVDLSISRLVEGQPIQLANYSKEVL